MVLGSKLLVTLGLPLRISPQKRCTDFKYILENLEAKLMDWRSKTLCWVGRGRLINSVIQAIPNYVMSFCSIKLRCFNHNWPTLTNHDSPYWLTVAVLYLFSWASYTCFMETLWTSSLMSLSFSVRWIDFITQKILKTPNKQY